MISIRFWKLVRGAMLAGGAVTMLALAACRPSMGRDYSEHMLRHMDRKVERLELNAEQEQKYQALRERLRGDLRKNYLARIASLQRVKQEFDKENPDVRAAANFVKEQMQSRQGFMQSTPDYFVEFYNILNPEQQREVRDWVRDRLEHFEPEGENS